MIKIFIDRHKKMPISPNGDYLENLLYCFLKETMLFLLAWK